MAIPLLTGAFAAAAELTIVASPVPFDEARTELTRQYMRARYGIVQDDIVIKPRMVVLHWTGGPTLAGALATFSPGVLGGARPELDGAGAVNVSAHFLVDRDGTIHRLMPETWMARHVIGLNMVAIGIENVGGGDAWPLTEAQVAANIALVRHLAARHPLTHLIGHHEYRRFEGHPYFLERDAGYRTVKVDPGPAFMAAVRAGVEDLGLAGPP